MQKDLRRICKSQVTRFFLAELKLKSQRFSSSCRIVVFEGSRPYGKISSGTTLFPESITSWHLLKVEVSKASNESFQS